MIILMILNLDGITFMKFASIEYIWMQRLYRREKLFVLQNIADEDSN